MSSSTPFFLAILAAAALAVVAGTRSTAQPEGPKEPQEPQPPRSSRAFFVFGDSLVDNGNNNFLATTARANIPPYGIDYPSHLPTGRFSNGLNLADLISEQLGMQPALPILSPELAGASPRLLAGANFASAGIGILNDTGFQFASIIRMPRQLELFQCYQNRLKVLVGADRARRVVNDGVVLIVVGGNDFVNNYFLGPITARRLQYPLPEYCQFVVSEYKKILMRLYDMGARTVLVTGTGPLGCVPAELAERSVNGQCAAEPERAAELYNTGLDDMIQGLNQQLGSDVFISVKAYMELHKEFISNPGAYGFSTTKIACCGQGPYNGLGLCNPTSNLCGNRNSYVFWDSYHPTERANRLIVQQILNGSKKYMHPMNLNTIMARGTTN